MKNFPSLFALLALLGLTLASCDPAHTLVIENKTKGPVEVSFRFQAGEHYYNFSEDSARESYHVMLNAAPPVSMHEIHLGLGTWEVTGVLDSLVAAIDHLEIVSDSSQRIIKGEAQLKPFFQSRISPQNKGIILIEVVEE